MQIKIAAAILLGATSLFAQRHTEQWWELGCEQAEWEKAREIVPGKPKDNQMLIGCIEAEIQLANSETKKTDLPKLPDQKAVYLLWADWLLTEVSRHELEDGTTAVLHYLNEGVGSKTWTYLKGEKAWWKAYYEAVHQLANAGEGKLEDKLKNQEGLKLKEWYLAPTFSAAKEVFDVARKTGKSVRVVFSKKRYTVKDSLVVPSGSELWLPRGVELIVSVKKKIKPTVLDVNGVLRFFGEEGDERVTLRLTKCNREDDQRMRGISFAAESFQSLIGLEVIFGRQIENMSGIFCDGGFLYLNQCSFKGIGKRQRHDVIGVQLSTHRSHCYLWVQDSTFENMTTGISACKCYLRSWHNEYNGNTYSVYFPVQNHKVAFFEDVFKPFSKGYALYHAGHYGNGIKVQVQYSNVYGLLYLAEHESCEYDLNNNYWFGKGPDKEGGGYQATYEDESKRRFPEAGPR